jgi:hypothetical protein
MSNDNKNINVYLTESEDRQRVYGDDKPDPNKHFIIIQNESLTHKANLLITENHRLQKENDEKEDEVDKIETQVRYMRCELKNFVELRNMADKITEVCEKKIVHMNSQYEKTNKFIPKFLTQFVVGKSLSVINLLALCYVDRLTIPYILTTELISMLVTSTIAGVTPTDIITHKKEFTEFTKTQLDFTAKIKMIREEVKIAENGNDFISKYIESI